MRAGTAPDPIGSTIANRYRVEQLLGRGGMAAVYRVHDQRSGVEVALKRCLIRELRHRRRNEALLEREYHTLVQLAHPRIIAVYDYGVDKHGPYYTMELLEGRQLEQTERMPWRQTCALLCDVASSLAILHSRGHVHRDVSLRNVHYGADQRAKLIDFGAMMSMGTAKDAVGTPPFMAPEVLQLQALDGRADLFSLGALGYRLLTGRHAFAAKRLRELRDVWRSRPQPPAAFVPEIPHELSALILQLLTLDRAGRPHNAAEVMERLCGIADLQLESGAEVSRAYLTTPTLVGRAGALLAVRRRMLSLVRGDGGVLLVQGEAGSGRSRMLDACALEGKLLGASVVRADARDSGSGDWGVARALCTQLIQEFQQQALTSARLSRNVLAHVLQELRSEEMHSATGYAPERSVLLRDMRDWMLALSKSQRLLIVVDDADRIDEPSAALLSSLAPRAQRYPLLLALSVERDAARGASAALRLLHDYADTIELEHVRPHETEALMRSLFGDAPNLPLWAARVHALCHGSPRAAMELAQHLVDTGRARYEAGSWVLPEQLEHTALPDSLSASLSTRLSELSADAHELADVLAITDGDVLSIDAYPALTDHGQVKRVFAAKVELVAARILRADSQGYDFTQRGFVTVLLDTMTPERRERIHLRVAHLLATTGSDPLRRAHHLLEAGVDDEAIELLCRLDLGAQSPSVQLLATAIERGQQLRLPASTLHRLRMALLIHAPFALDYERFRRVVPVVLDQLEGDSGLSRYRELGELEPGQRLQAALMQTQQRFLETPVDARVHGIFEAIGELARLSGAIASMAVTTFDHGLLESLPALDPLFPLSPTLEVVASLVKGARLWLQHRLLQSYATYASVLTRIAEPDRAGLDPAQHTRIHLALVYTMALLDTTWGNDMAEVRAKELETHRELRVNAWRVRALLKLAHGNTKEYLKCMRRAQLLQAQDGLSERYVGSTAGIELVLHWRLGDVVAVKARLDTLSSLAARHAGWRSIELLGRAAYSELQGQPEAALQPVLQALELAPPLQLPFFPALAACHVHVLTQLGRLDEAAERAHNYLTTCKDLELSAPDMVRLGALALARAGQVEEAYALLMGHIARAESVGSSGYALGAFYESAARIALEASDRARFEQFITRCATEYEKAKNPSVSARLAQLIELARERELGPSDAALQLRSALEPTATESEYETVHSRIAECVDGPDRGRCALTLLLQSTPSPLGLLYTIDPGGRVSLLAALPDPPADDGVQRWLEHYVSGWADANDTEEVTASETGATLSTKTGNPELPPQRYLDTDGRWLQAVPLIAAAVSNAVAGVLVVQVHSGEVVNLPRELTASIASELLAHGDAEGL